MVELPDPTPDKGQLVLGVLRCGICGSDLHAREHCDGLAEVMEELDYDEFMRTSSATVMGHEFVGEVRERGRGARREFREGAHVVSFPLVRHGRDAHPIGLSPLAPGGYAEQVLVEQSMSFVVPNGLAPDVAVLTEPMAVALHAVNKSVGLAPRRRDRAGLRPGRARGDLLAQGAGRAHHRRLRPLGRPARASRPGAAPTSWSTRPRSRRTPSPASKHVTSAPDLFRFALGSMDRLRRVPGWQHVFRAADAVGAATPSGPVVFECVGVPGMIESVVSPAPLASRVVVVGVCMGGDSFRPSMAINKELDLRFVLCYTPLEFRDTLHALADGKVDASALVTGTVGLDGVANAFDALGDPERHAKILIDPGSEALTPR